MRKLGSTNHQNEEKLKENCGMVYTLSLIGGRWKPAILWSLVNNGRLRYSELKNIIPGNISERILALQLKELQADGLVKRTIHPDVPPRVEYELTGLGLSMKPLLESISSWGEMHREITEKAVKTK